MRATIPNRDLTNHVGSRAFNAIVGLIRNRTGWDFNRTFNAVLKENRDLLDCDFSPTDHIRPFNRLLNRAQAATGLGACATTDAMATKVNRMANAAFPALCDVPVALKWDVCQRAAAQLEKRGVGQKLRNRTDGNHPGLNDADWNAANKRGAEVLDFLETEEDDSADYGKNPKFEKMTDRSKTWCFVHAMERLMADEGLSREAAFNKLKETQPVFWTGAILAFDPAWFGK